MRYALLAVAAVAALSCASPVPTSSEAEIYEAILFDPEFTGELGRAKRVMVVAELADPGTLIRSAISDFADLGADQTAIDSLRAVRMQFGAIPGELWRHPKLQVERGAGDNAARDRQLSVGPAFRDQFPGHRGFVRLSPIGFNDSRTEAVVAALLECGGMCSHGNMFVLQKEQAGWRIVRRRVSWIS